MGLFDLSRRRRGGRVINLNDLSNASKKNTKRVLTMKRRIKRRKHTSRVRSRVGRSRSRSHSRTRSRTLA